MGTPRRVATMTAYDSIERGAADECEPLRGRRSRTFTLTQLLVACGAVCVCAIGATTVVNTHLANFDDGSAFDDELALADSDDDSDDDSDADDSDDAADDDSDDDSDDDDSQEGAQLGQYEKSPRAKCLDKANWELQAGLRRVQSTYDKNKHKNKQKCSMTTKQCRNKCWKA